MEGIALMAKKRAALELVHGSGNVFRDLGDPDADIKQLKAILAAEIIKQLDRKALSVRRAHAMTGIDASDFARIRNANLERFTVDRLMNIVNRLGSRIDVAVRLRSRPIRQPAA
jgi:predicted XRE-type DNA-binding protein